MSRLSPPPGTVTRETAVRILLREKVITSAAMLNKLKGVERVVPQGRSHGFYKQDVLLEIINDRRLLNGLPPIEHLFEEGHKIIARQATAEDMVGVYEVAHKLFGPTTSANTRIALLQKSAAGNIVVTDEEKVVSYAHLYPMHTEPLMQFLTGKFRGSGITVDHLNPFEPGKVVDVLIKSLGSYHEHAPTSRMYSQMLFRSLCREVIDWGRKGYIIHRVYATSETPSGIEAAVEIKMQSRGKIPGSKGKRRYAFELDPYTSNYIMARAYCKSLNQWQKEHPQEYAHAWENWQLSKSK